MNKDALLATFIGFVVGLVVTGLVLYGPGLTKNFPKLQFPKISFSLPSFNKPKNTPTPTPSEPTKSHSVSVEAPLADAIETEEKILVSGVTSPQATVIISGPSDEVVFNANGDGKYAGKVLLAEGKNDVVITSISTTGTVATQTVTVYYTPESW